MCSRSVAVPDSTTATLASGTSTPSFSTRLVTRMRYAPLRNRSRSATRSLTGVWCVIAGMRNSRLMRYTVALSSVKISVRSRGWFESTSSSTRSLPSVPYARDFASRCASIARRPWGVPLAMMNCFQPSSDPSLMPLRRRKSLRTRIRSS